MLKYNLHDVRMTNKFREHSKQQIAFREQLTQKYNRNFMNHNDTKIGKDYFAMRLEEEGIELYGEAGGKRFIRQSPRHIIFVKDCLFDYYNYKQQ